MPEIDDIKVTEKWLSAKSQKLLLKCSNFPSSQKKKGKKKEKKKGKNTETSHYPGKALLPARLSHQATTQMMFH